MSVAMTVEELLTRQPGGFDRLFSYWAATGDGTGGGITISWTPSTLINIGDEVRIVDVHLATNDSARDFYLSAVKNQWSALGAPGSSGSIEILGSRTDSWYNNFATAYIFTGGDHVYFHKWGRDRDGYVILGRKLVTAPVLSGGFGTNTNTKVYQAHITFDILRNRT